MKIPRFLDPAWRSFSDGDGNAQYCCINTPMRTRSGGRCIQNGTFWRRGLGGLSGARAPRTGCRPGVSHRIAARQLQRQHQRHACALAYRLDADLATELLHPAPHVVQPTPSHAGAERLAVILRRAGSYARSPAPAVLARHGPRQIEGRSDIESIFAYRLASSPSPGGCRPPGRFNAPGRPAASPLPPSRPSAARLPSASRPADKPRKEC